MICSVHAPPPAFGASWYTVPPDLMPPANVVPYRAPSPEPPPREVAPYIPPAGPTATAPTGLSPNPFPKVYRVFSVWPCSATESARADTRACMQFPRVRPGSMFQHLLYGFSDP